MRGALARNNQLAAARAAARRDMGGRGRLRALSTENRGSVGPKSSSGAHFHVRGHEIGHLDEDLSGVGHSGMVLHRRGGYGSKMTHCDGRKGVLEDSESE